MKRYLKLAGLAAVMAVPNQANAQVTYNYTGPNLGVTIPDAVPAGLIYDITVPDSGALSAMSIGLTIGPPNHTWVGDLIMTITHGATTSDVFRRVGATTSTAVGSSVDFGGPYTFIDSAAGRLVDALAVNPIAPGSYRATTNTFVAPIGTGETVIALNTVFGGGNINGLWRINISDNAGGDTGAVSALSITLTVVPEPTSLALAAVGAGGLAWRRWRRKV